MTTTDTWLRSSLSDDDMKMFFSLAFITFKGTVNMCMGEFNEGISCVCIV